MTNENKYAIYEWANSQMFSTLYPNYGYVNNPYGIYGIDAAVYKGGSLISLEEWKFNSGPYQRLDSDQKAYLIEKTKYDKLMEKWGKTNFIITKDKGIKPKRKIKVEAFYRRFFSDAELILHVNAIHTDISKYYGKEYCEVTQFTTKKEWQGGYYIPLYAVDDNQQPLWQIREYTPFEKQMYNIILTERNNRLENENK